MFRRTTLLITATFLVLLAIPLGYLAITWSPANPLEFRLIKAPAENYTPNTGGSEFIVEMKNTSRVPIHTYEAQLHMPSMRDFGFIDVFRISTPALGKRKSPSTLALRPGETRRCSGTLAFAMPSGQSLTDGSVQCKWITETKWQTYRLAYWLYIHLPPPLNQWITPPVEDITTSPLLK